MKSILQGHDVILDGACWRAENGKSIKIWQYHWLPGKHPTKILSLMVEIMEEATVDCLIYEGTRMWNAVMVDEIFAPQEAEEIKNIPLARKLWMTLCTGHGSTMGGLVAKRGIGF